VLGTFYYFLLQAYISSLETLLCKCQQKEKDKKCLKTQKQLSLGFLEG